MTSLPSLGFVGVGNMGYPMAKNLLSAGYPLTVYDLRPHVAHGLLESGAKWASSLAELARSSDVVLASLPRPSDVEAVALGEHGVLANLRPGCTFIDLTTNSPTVARKVFAVGRDRGVHVLDAAVSGGVHGAASRRMTVMVGGDREVLERCRSILETISDNVVYCGPSGSGTATKIVNNMIALSASVILGEALITGVKSGLDLKMLTDIISKSSGSTWRLSESFPKFLFKGRFSDGFAIDLALKDLRLGLEMARECGLNLDLISRIEQKYVEAQNRGWGSLHSEAVVRLLEEEAGVELRIPES